MTPNQIVDMATPWVVNLCLAVGAVGFLVVALWFFHNLYAAFFVVGRMLEVEQRITDLEDKGIRGLPGPMGPKGDPGKCECSK